MFRARKPHSIFLAILTLLLASGMVAVLIKGVLAVCQIVWKQLRGGVNPRSFLSSKSRMDTAQQEFDKL